MITPHFEVSQDADFVTIRIRVPHVHMEDGEFYVQAHEFKFHLRPYFLRLTFRQLLTEDGREAATYDASAGVLSVRVPKATPGEHFDDLGMLSELLRKPDRSAAPKRGPLIEVMSSTTAEGAEADEDDDACEDDEDDDADIDEAIAADCEVDQELPSADALLGRVRYGFNDAYSAVRAYRSQHRREIGDRRSKAAREREREHRRQHPNPNPNPNQVFVGLEDEGVLQLKDPEHATPQERRAARLQSEDEAFDPDHYIADLMDDDQVQAALRHAPWWSKPAPAAPPAAPAAVPMPAGAAAVPGEAAGQSLLKHLHDVGLQGEGVAAEGAVAVGAAGAAMVEEGAVEEGGWLAMGSEEQQALLQLPRPTLTLTLTVNLTLTLTPTLTLALTLTRRCCSCLARSS